MPPKKRTKTTHSDGNASASKAPAKGNRHATSAVARSRNIRGRRGGLQDMPKMPLDLLFEIFGFLHPKDLLSLSRTTRDFRALLMNRNAARFWEEARKQVEGLPNKPPLMSEPAFANLLFCNHCHNCLKSGAHITAYWDICARYCASCREELFTRKCDDALEPIWLDFEVETHDIVMRVPIQSDRFRGVWYHKPELDKLMKEWKSLANKTQKRRYIRDRKAFVKQSKEFSYQLERWQDGLKQRAAAEQQSIKEMRFEAILAKLRLEGWSEELDRMDRSSLNGLCRIDGVFRATKLTDKGWASIREPVLQHMQKFKSLRLSKERERLLNSRLRYLKQAVYAYQHAKWSADRKNSLYVGLADCAYMPEVRAIIEDTSADVTKDVVKLKLKEVLPGLIDSWVEERRVEVATLLRTELGVNTRAVAVQDPLQLAIASFGCTSCRTDRLRWPQIAEHRCYNRHIEGTDLYGQCVKSYVAGTINLPIRGTPWMCMDQRTEHARGIISLCGADPDTITYEEMNNCVVRLACRQCATYARQEIFDWKGALAHDWDRHRNLKPLPGRWMVVPEENAAQARALEAAMDAKPLDTTLSSYHHPEQYHCSWCGFADLMQGMYQHLQCSHDKSRIDSKLNRDFYLIERYRPNVWMFSDVFSEGMSEKETVAAGRGFFASF